MEDIHHLLDVLQRDPQRSVLATIIHVEGAAYRKAGATMLFQEDGTQIGILSGGCLETDLAARASGIWEQGVSLTVVYDMGAEDDLSWGQGAGCNGKSHVLLESVDETLGAHLETLKLCLDQGMMVSLAKKLNPEGAVAEYVFLTEQSQAFGTWQGEISDALKRALFKGRSSGHLDQREQKSGMLSIGGMSDRLYVQHFTPKPRVVIFGAGPDAKPLAAFAAQCGFSVTVADWRSASCSQTHFPQADELLLGQPFELLGNIKLTPRDSVIIMTHNFQHDKELLRELLQQEVLYLGILGPHERTSRLLDGKVFPEGLRSPVGLAIGAEGAEEIAISILADVIQHRRSRMTNQVASP